MRDIKFRAWNIATKKMIDLKKITPFALNMDADTDGLFIPFSDGLLLMQYTGLKDKNGKEIYEGDILKDKLSGMIWEIRFGFCKKSGFNGWYCHNPNRETTLNGDYETDTNSQVEIIGNIYENPELLK